MERFKRFSKPIVICSFLAIAILALLDRTAIYRNIYLLLLFNTLFIGFLPITAAVLAARIYLERGSTRLFLMGCGMLVIGIGSIAVGYLQFYPDANNASITLFDSCAFVASTLNLLAVIQENNAYTKFMSNRSRIRRMFLAVCGIVSLILLIIFFSVHHYLPEFINQNGFARIRNVLTNTSVAFYFCSCIFHLKQYQSLKWDYHYWYSQASFMIALGLFAFCLTKNIGTILNWAGWACLYWGSIFAFISLMDFMQNATASKSILPANVNLPGDRHTFDSSNALEQYLYREKQFYIITGNKNAEDALHISESLLRALFDGTTDPAFLKDHTGRIIMANAAFCRSIGIPLSNVYGRTAFDIYEDKEKVNLFTKNDQQVMSLNITQTFEEIIPAPKGDRIFLTTKTPWHDADGNVIGLIGIAQDITEWKKMELEMQQQAEELQKRNEYITNFFVNISHDLKTPLSIIMLAVNMHERQLDQTGGGVDRKYLTMMKQNSYRLLRMVTNLLDITKLDAGFMEPNWEKVNIIALLGELVSSVDSIARQNKLMLEFSSLAKEENIYTDSLMMERIMLNLISNAIKHTPAGGSIYVSVKISETNIVISVKDTGEGIPENKKEIIFDRFQQVNSSFTRSSEGCGIGLALTKSLVELLNGTISVKSTYGMGSEFIVELPILHRDEEKPLVSIQGGMELRERVMLELSDISIQ